MTYMIDIIIGPPQKLIEYNLRKITSKDVLIDSTIRGKFETHKLVKLRHVPRRNIGIYRNISNLDLLLESKNEKWRGWYAKAYYHSERRKLSWMQGKRVQSRHPRRTLYLSYIVTEHFITVLRLKLPDDVTYRLTMHAHLQDGELRAKVVKGRKPK